MSSSRKSLKAPLLSSIELFSDEEKRPVQAYNTQASSIDSRELTASPISSASDIELSISPLQSSSTADFSENILARPKAKSYLHPQAGLIMIAQFKKELRKETDNVRVSFTNMLISLSRILCLLFSIGGLSIAGYFLHDSLQIQCAIKKLMQSIVTRRQSLDNPHEKVDWLHCDALVETDDPNVCNFDRLHYQMLDTNCDELCHALEEQKPEIIGEGVGIAVSSLLIIYLIYRLTSDARTIYDYCTNSNSLDAFPISYFSTCDSLAKKIFFHFSPLFEMDEDTLISSAREKITEIETELKRSMPKMGLFQVMHITQESTEKKLAENSELTGKELKR